MMDEQQAKLDDAIKWCKEHPEQRVYCNKCRRTTLHRVLKTTSEERIEEYGAGMYDPESGEIESCIIFDMLECCGCREAVLRRTFHCPDPDVHSRMAQLLWVGLELYAPTLMSGFSAVKLAQRGLDRVENIEVKRAASV
jgi:hypothetical protein